MKKACDEEVIRTMSREKRKEYAYALLHIATGNGSGNKRVFVAPVCFAEGNVRSRIRNNVKYRCTLPGIGTAAVIGRRAGAEDMPSATYTGKDYTLTFDFSYMDNPLPEVLYIRM